MQDFFQIPPPLNLTSSHRKQSYRLPISLSPQLGIRYIIVPSPTPSTFQFMTMAATQQSTISGWGGDGGECVREREREEMGQRRRRRQAANSSINNFLRGGDDDAEREREEMGQQQTQQSTIFGGVATGDDDGERERRDEVATQQSTFF